MDWVGKGALIRVRAAHLGGLVVQVGHGSVSQEAEDGLGR
jgi:hypothetical protein